MSSETSDTLQEIADKIGISATLSGIRKLHKRFKDFFATNTPFSHVKHAQFVKRPSYTPPTCRSLGSDILDSVYESEKTKCRELLSGKTVSMYMDG